MNFWIVDENGTKKYFGNRINYGEDPIEILGFRVVEPTTLNVMITGENIPDGLSFEYIVFRAPEVKDSNNNLQFGWQFTNGNDETFNGTTIVGHSAASSTTTVGAAFFGYTPAFPLTYKADMLEHFSSEGGLDMIHELLEKPDFIAPDAGNNTFFGVDLEFDTDSDPNFAGTSAAVPAAAGVEALITQAFKEFKGEDEVDPSYLKQLLKDTSLPFDPAVNDKLKNGAGLIQADRALLSLFNPSPDIKSLGFPSDPFILDDVVDGFTLTVQMFYPILTYDENGLPILDGNLDPIPLLADAGTKFTLRDQPLEIEPDQNGDLIYTWINVDDYLS